MSGSGVGKREAAKRAHETDDSKRRTREQRDEEGSRAEGQVDTATYKKILDDWVSKDAGSRDPVTINGRQAPRDDSISVHVQWYVDHPSERL